MRTDIEPSPVVHRLQRRRLEWHVGREGGVGESEHAETEAGGRALPGSAGAVHRARISSANIPGALIHPQISRRAATKRKPSEQSRSPVPCCFPGRTTQVPLQSLEP